MPQSGGKEIILKNDIDIRDALELISQTWEHTDEGTKAANDNDIRHYVEFGDFERDAFINWYEGLSDGLYLDEVRSEVEYLESVISAYLTTCEEPQYYRILDV